MDEVIDTFFDHFKAFIRWAMVGKRTGMISVTLRELVHEGCRFWVICGHA